MIHFKPHWHFPKWKYCFLEFATKQHRKCMICDKEQKSNRPKTNNMKKPTLDEIKKAYGKSYNKYKHIIDDEGKVFYFDDVTICRKDFMIHCGYDYYIHKDLTKKISNRP